MNSETSKLATSPVATWAMCFGAAGLFGGLLMGLGKGCEFAFAVGMLYRLGSSQQSAARLSASSSRR